MWGRLWVEAFLFLCQVFKPAHSTNYAVGTSLTARSAWVSIQSFWITPSLIRVGNTKRMIMTLHSIQHSWWIEVVIRAHGHVHTNDSEGLSLGVVALGVWAGLFADAALHKCDLCLNLRIREDSSQFLECFFFFQQRDHQTIADKKAESRHDWNSCTAQ